MYNFQIFEMDGQMFRENQILNEKLSFSLKQIKQQDAELVNQRQSMLSLQKQNDQQINKLNQTISEQQYQIDQANFEQSNKVDQQKTEIQLLQSKLQSKQQYTDQLEQNLHIENKKIKMTLQEIHQSLQQTSETALPGVIDNPVSLSVSSDLELNDLIQKLASTAAQLNISVKAFKVGNKLVREKLRSENKQLKIDLEIEKKRKIDSLRDKEEACQKQHQLENEINRYKLDDDNIRKQLNEYCKVNCNLQTEKEQLHKQVTELQTELNAVNDEENLLNIQLNEYENRVKTIESMLGRYKIENDQLKTENKIINENLAVFIHQDPDINLSQEDLVKMVCDVEDEGLDEYLAKKLMQDM